MSRPSTQSGAGANSGFQVGPEIWVRCRYSAFDEDGEPVEEGSHEVSYVHGFGVLLPRLEAALEGKRAGDRCTITLPPTEAFGSRRDEAVLECDPEEFEPDVRAGDRLEAETADGGVVVLRVLEVRPDAVVVDTNHPLAGQRVRFELELMEVRPASIAELEFAERSAAEREAPGTNRAADGPLIPVQSLLRSPSRRYERGARPGDPAEDSAPDDEES